MTKIDLRALINKYAILIFIGYLSDFLITSGTHHILAGLYDKGSQIIIILSYSTIIIQVTINIIAAVLISKDMRALNIRNNLIVVMTVLFSLIGITMFFITLNNRSEKAGNQQRIEH